MIIQLIEIILGFIALLVLLILSVFGGEIKSGGAEKTTRGLFIFRRDLRIADNTALFELSSRVDRIHCVFIFDPRQVTKANPYKSNPAVHFMIDSLLELSSDIKAAGGRLNFLRGDPAAIIPRLMKDLKIDVVAFSADYTPFAKARDGAIMTACKKASVDVITTHDCLLLGRPMGTDSGSAYKVFGPFHRAFRMTKIAAPNSAKVTNWDPAKITGALSKEDVKGIAGELPKGFQPAVQGGRKAGIRLLNAAEKEQTQYNSKRNQLAYQTTGLSAHNKFGTVSIREICARFRHLPRGGSDLVKQLFWRDFYYNIMIDDPNALKGNYDKKFNGVKWKEPGDKFIAWKEGRTGFPVVDACMRELAATGSMHNRGRMIVADFLVKLILINWRFGEQFFAQSLIDYDPAQNNYNWQWVAGTGPFAQPYFRVFNPWTQAKKFDPDCGYIRKWVPELAKVPIDQIHKWDTQRDETVAYPVPVISYEKSREKYLKSIKSHLRGKK